MNILVFYDGSPQSKRALEKGINLGKTCNAELHLLTSFAMNESPNKAIEFLETWNEEELIFADGEAAVVGLLVKKLQLPHKIHQSNHGKSPGEDIVDWAEQLKADYIVMSVNVPSRLQKIGFDRTTQYVVLHSPCPVMTVN
jgi:nucleotide-binding universal stress UspA family protein